MSRIWTVLTAHIPDVNVWNEDCLDWNMNDDDRKMDSDVRIMDSDVWNRDKIPVLFPDIKS